MNFKATLFADALQNSLQEQTKVTVFFGGQRLEGVVSGIQGDNIELRVASRRCLIRIDRIDAVMRE